VPPTCEVVNDDPDSAHLKLAEEAAAAFKEVAPLVESVSQLPLADHVTIRLVTPSQFVTINKRLTRHTLSAIKARSVRHGLLLITARLLAPHVIGRNVRQEWSDHAGQAYATPEGEEEVLLIPAALDGMEISATTLRAILAHELTHTAQHLLYPRGAQHFVESFMVQAGKDARADFDALGEGHAHWVCARVTEHLYGRAITRLHKNDRVPPAHKRGQRFVEYVVDQASIDEVNHALSDIAVMPTSEEIDEPQ
jgi:hypothetical protein